jgi:cytochrome c oxidase cbb3-type subunit IV
MDLKELQVYATFFMTIFLVVMLYGYIVHLYRSEKKGVKDYEKYGKIALDDEIDSRPIEKNPKFDNKDEGAK